ncbi:MAG: hypothetical protein ACOC2W_00670 [bacterium]
MSKKELKHKDDIKFICPNCESVRYLSQLELNELNEDLTPTGDPYIICSCGETMESE